MPIVVPKTGVYRLLNWCLNSTDPEPSSLVLALFKNDVTPDWDTVNGDFEVADFDGYESKTVMRENWDLAPGNEVNIVGTYQTEFDWTVDDGSGYVYGYLVYEPGDNITIWCERFDEPVQVEPGLQVKIRPRLAGWSRYLPPTP